MDRLPESIAGQILAYSNLATLNAVARTSSTYRSLAAGIAWVVCLENGRAAFGDQLRSLAASVDNGKAFSSHLRARRAKTERDPSVNVDDFEFVAELRLDPSSDAPSFVGLSVSNESFVSQTVMLRTDELAQTEYVASKRMTAPIRVWCRRRTDDSRRWALLYDRPMDLAPAGAGYARNRGRDPWPGVFVIPGVEDYPRWRRIRWKNDDPWSDHGRRAVLFHGTVDDDRRIYPEGGSRYHTFFFAWQLREGSLDEDREWNRILTFMQRTAACALLETDIHFHHRVPSNNNPVVSLEPTTSLDDYHFTLELSFDDDQDAIALPLDYNSTDDDEPSFRTPELTQHNYDRLLAAVEGDTVSVHVFCLEKLTAKQALLYCTQDPTFLKGNPFADRRVLTSQPIGRPTNPRSPTATLMTIVSASASTLSANIGMTRMILNHLIPMRRTSTLLELLYFSFISTSKKATSCFPMSLCLRNASC